MTTLIAEADTLKELKNAYSENFSHPGEVGFLKSVVVSADGSPNGVPQIDLRAAPGQAGKLGGSAWLRSRQSTLLNFRFDNVPADDTSMQIGKINSDFRFYGEDTDFTLRANAGARRLSRRQKQSHSFKSRRRPFQGPGKEESNQHRLGKILLQKQPLLSMVLLFVWTHGALRW